MQPCEVYMFIDERIKPMEQCRRLIIGCLVIERRQWEALYSEAKKVGATRRKRRLDAIADLLGHAGGFALIGYADLPPDFVPPGELDGTDDIPRMKRADNVWSQAVLAAAAAVLACLRASGVANAVIDLFYDPKDLTVTHRNAYERTLRETLSEIAREDPNTHEVQAKPTLIFRRVEQVPKRQSHGEADELQHGTNLAHHLCSQATDIIGGRSVPRIVVRDHTEVLRNMISKFIGDESSDEGRAT